MIVISKKRIITLTSMVVMCLFVCNICLNNSNNIKEETKETVALPVTNKVIVIDAGHRKAR